MKRTLIVFFGAVGFALALAILKALIVSGLGTLPPVRVLLFAASMFGVLATLFDWALLRNVLRIESGPSGGGVFEAGLPAVASVPTAPQPIHPVIARARLQPMVFREICPPPSTGLSFYGGAPIGSASLVWPRDPSRGVPLSFVMQWDCRELSTQDVTGLLPHEGVLYLFADLGWNAFEFVHVSGPTGAWTPLPLPSDLPPIEGGGGQVPYCSSLVAEEHRCGPVLLPKWPFTPLAFSFPASPADTDPLFWNDGEAVGEALLRLEYPEGVPPTTHLRTQKSSFRRPFSSFPYDYASVRIVAVQVLHELRHPSKWILSEASEHERETTFHRWRDEAIHHYAMAAAHDPAAIVPHSMADDLWRWMEGLDPLLRPGWVRVVKDCINVSLGLGTKAELPPDLIAACAEQHRLALAYLHEEYADRRTPEALAAWEQRKAEGRLKEVRTVHAPCPNHMFGPPSYVQGYVEEHVNDMLLLLELSTRQAIAHEFGEGVMQFMIRPDDLRERRFDKVQLIASAY